jgi:glycosyltransferase involved in cell wall biosynthesis
MQKLRLAHFESSMNWGGQELRVIEQMEWMLAQGYEVWLIARPESAILDEAAKRNLPCFALRVRGSVNLKTLYQLLRFLLQKKINLLDCHSNKDAYYGMWTRLLTNIKVIRSRHVTDRIKIKGGRALIWRYGNDHIITTADAVKQQIIALKLASADSIYTARAGVDEKRFQPHIDAVQLKKQLGIPLDHTVIANIGMIRSDKGQLYYAKACNRLLDSQQKLSCIQVGEATLQTKRYKALVVEEIQQGKHADRFHFLGYHDDIENYLAIADIVAIASIGTEAQTRLVSQAYLMKKAVVATRTGGLPEMVHDQQTGLLCEAKSGDALAVSILRLLDDSELRDALTDNAYTYAFQHMTIDLMMQEMIALYEQTINATSGDL